MREITQEVVRSLLQPQSGPCISLYQPTHRTYQESRQDPIRFKNLLKKAEESLRDGYGVRDVRALCGPLHELVDDHSFWTHQLDGLAILAAPGRTEIFTLQHSMPELAIVADSFHVKPLVRAVQSAERYQLLCLTWDKVWLLEGNRYVLDEIEMPHVPTTLVDALGEELTEPHLTVGSYGKGAGGPHSGHGEPAMYHGHGGRKAERDVDQERFFRKVDEAVLEHHSRPTGLPLMLVALPNHQAVFRGLSENPFLMPEGIAQDPASLSVEELTKLGWERREPLYRQKLDTLVEHFGSAQARQQGTEDLEEACRAASSGRVGTLLVEADRQLPGSIAPDSGKITQGELSDPAHDDLLDDLAELVFRTGGEVLVVPKEQMPSSTGLAAIYRY